MSLTKWIPYLFMLVVAIPTIAQDESNTDQPDTEKDETHETLTVYGEAEKELIAINSFGATKTNTSIVTTPMSISVVTAERLKDLGAQNVQDMIAYSAGVRSGTYGPDTRGDWSTVRGASPVEYVDGLKSLFGNYNNTRPNPFNLGQVEILKGPSSVLYGQGSIAGIVNLVSKRPDFQKQGQAWVSYGNYERAQVGLDMTGPVGENNKLLYRVVGMSRDSESQVDYVDDNTTMVSPSLTWRPSNETSLTLLTNFQKNEAGTSTQFLPWEGTILPGPNGTIPTSRFLSEPDFDRYDTEQTAITAILEHRLSDSWRFHGAARYTDSTADYRSMWPSFPPTIQPDGRTINRTAYISDASSQATVADFQMIGLFQTGEIEHDFIVGLDIQDATTDNNTFYGFFAGGPLDIYDPVYGQPLGEMPVADNPATLATQGGVYIQDQMRLNQNWLLSMGLRYDETESKTEGFGNAQDDHKTTGRLGVMYLMENGFSPYLNYSQSFLPTIGANFEGTPYKPLEGEQTELGFKYQPVGTGHLLTASVYDITEQNRLTTDPNNPANRIQTGEIESQGFELEAQMTWDQFNFLGAYSYTSAKVSESTTGDLGNHLSAIPDHLVSFWSIYKPARFKGFRLGTGVRYVGETWDGAENLKTDAFTLFDLKLGYTYGDLDFSLDVDNVADKVHVVSVLARGDAFYGARRMVGFTMNYRF